MKKNTLLAGCAALLLTASCGHKNNMTVVENTPTDVIEESDSTIYGLACDGCNDTVIIFLRTPYDNTDPDTLNILQATKRHRVFGRALIGDKLAIVRNPVDTTVADMVVVTEDLQAQWCYRVKPTLRQRADMSTLNNLISEDSLNLLLATEREYGFHLKDEGNAFPIGRGNRAATTDEEEAVVYPELRRYFEWHLYNGKLVLQMARTDSLQQRHLVISDTADIVELTTDTLVLRFADHEQGYYKRPVVSEESEKE